MCWDAVAACQGRPPGRYIDTFDEIVRDVATLRSIPEGATIGFFDRGTLAHVMISLGNGEAAGNKNSCVGIGEMVGWERHDLVPHMHGSSFGSRNLTLRFRRYI